MADRLPAIGQSFDDEPHSGYVSVREPKAERPLAYRYTMAPLGEYEDGSFTLAWPQMLIDMYEGGVRSFEQGRQLPRVDSEGYYAGTPRAEPLDAFNAASAAPMGTVGLRATGLTKDVGDLGMFAGRGAKTADHAKLAEAERLASQGAPREQIWNDTGWFQGVDGKWRFEIDDSASVYNPTRGSTRVRHSLSHPDLADAYPDLPGMKLSFSERPSNGAFYQAQDRIGLGSSPHPDDHRVLLHELQHAIQNKEGMQFGSNWNDIGRDAYRKTAGEVEARATEQRLPMSADERAARPPWLDYDVPEAKQMFANDANASAPSIALNAMDELPPIRAYHGTNARFSTFDPSKTDEAGFHFGSKDQAASREIAKNGLFSLPWPLGKGWRTIPVDIYPNKIADLTADPVKATGYSLAKRLVDDGIAPDSLLREATRQHVKGDKAGSTSTVRDWLVDNGYDLVRYPNNYEGGGPSYLALGTGNVKHARSGKTLFANPETASYPSLLLNSEDGQHRSFIDDLPRISTRDE